MTQEDYEQKRSELWYEYTAMLRRNCASRYVFDKIFDRAYALGKQEKDAKKKPTLTDKEVYALESAISELESLMDGTMDEDYHKENKIVINALKRIIKKYEKK